MSSDKSDKLNPYVNEEGQGELRNSVVAFIDILGFKERVRDAKNNGTSQELLAEFQDAIKVALFSLKDHFSEDFYNLSDGSSEIKDSHKFRIFSDCILIGCPISDTGHPATFIKGRHEFFTVLHTLYLLQTQLVNRGFFVRGAIAADELYMDDVTIYGIGLIDAYEAELKQAKYPRIILTESAEAMFREIDKGFQSQNHNNYLSHNYLSHNYLSRYLNRDCDGLFFLNYLESINIADYPFLEELETHKKVIEDRLQKYHDKPNILEIYVWAANYHNWFCDHDNKNEYRIDISQYQMQSIVDTLLG